MNNQISYGLGLFQGDGCFGINKKKKVYNNLFEYKAPYVSRKHERVNKLVNC